ncbi:MAG: 4Fe-4S dicluster domain-containing protein [bacterium]|jgi:heterodisulfide reductase subunit C
MHTVGSATSEEIDIIGGRELARLCYSCGICVGDCPAARFSDDFNPRQIFLRVCLGIGRELVGRESPIWKCTTCYTCHERCPAGVKPLEVIIALRNLSFREGTSPEGVANIRRSVIEKGVAGALTRRAMELREKMGLPAAEPGDAKELGLITGHE